MYEKRGEGAVDGDLLVRVAGLSHASQRWLRMALLAIEDLETDTAKPSRRRRGQRKGEEEAVRERPVGNLEDVIRGKSTLDAQLEAYPELSDEMEGLAEVIDMLREAGAARRRTGEQILREEILGREGEQKADDDEPPPDEEPDEEIS
jgi:hypothetical protein